MVPTIIVLFLFISYSQEAISSSSTSDFHTFSTSENRSLKYSNVQAHKELLERLMYGSMKQKNISVTVRKAGGARGGGGGRRGGGRGSGSGSGSGRGRGRSSGFRNGIYPNQRVPYTTSGHRSEASLLKVPLNLYVESFLLAFIFIFPFFIY